MRWLRRLLCWRPTVTTLAPRCSRCWGTGDEPSLPALACVRCDGSGSITADGLIRVPLTKELLLRIALGEFRRHAP